MEADDDPSLIRHYDPRWPGQFARLLAKRVDAAMNGMELRLEHVGSTAVPGLAAKPVIDMDVVVAPASLPAAITRLASLCYAPEGDLGVPGREAFLWPPGEMRHHLYLCAQDTAEWQRHVAFRDAIRANAELRDRYATLKSSLASQYHCDLGSYTRGKSAFIEAVLKARKQRPHPWRPSI